MAHTLLAQRILAAITANGGTVTFPGGSDTPQDYDAATDTWSGGSSVGDVTGKAVQTKSDPDRFTAAGLVLANPVTLLIAAKDLAIVPTPGMAFVWAGTQYTAKLADPHGVDEETLYYNVAGDA